MNEKDETKPAALSGVSAPGVDDALQDACDEILNRLEGWAKAYPESMFHEPTKAEREWLHKERPGLMDCIAASMGRHMARMIEGDIAKLRAALSGVSAPVGVEEIVEAIVRDRLAESEVRYAGCGDSCLP